METLERKQLPEERGGDERAVAARECAQRAGEHAVERRVRFVLLRDLVDRFEHRHRVGEQHVLLAQRAIRLDGLGLRHNVEFTPAVTLERDPSRRLEARPEPAGRLADALRDGPYLAVSLSEDRDDAI